MRDKVDEIRKNISFWKIIIAPILDSLSKEPSSHIDVLKDAEQLSGVIAAWTYLLKDFLELSGAMQQIEECRIKENCIFEDDTFKEFLHDIQIDADELQTQAINVQWQLNDFLGEEDSDDEKSN